MQVRYEEIVESEDGGRWGRGHAGGEGSEDLEDRWLYFITMRTALRGPRCSIRSSRGTFPKSLDAHKSQ